MAAIDVVNRIFREFKRYTGDGLPNEPTGAPLPIGDPQSGPNSPKKSELREGLLAPLSETEAFRDEAEDFRNEAEAFAALSGPTGVYSGSFTGDGVETIFVMTVEPTSAAHVWVGLGGVLQDPSTYTIDGTDLIFSEAPPDGVAGHYRIVSIADGKAVPPDGSVTTAKLASSAVEAAKIATGAVETAKLADGAATKVKLAASSVDSTKIDATDALAIRTAIAGSGYLPGAPVIIMASGSFTKATYPGARAFRVQVQAPGGGGGGASTQDGAAGGGGGSGGYSESLLLASALSSSETVTIGAVGAAGVAAAGTGGTGGATSFGAHVTANGGLGGVGGASSSSNRLGGAGGAVGTGTVVVGGGSGITSTAGSVSGSGAASPNLGGPGAGRGTAGAGNAGSNYGGGGGGGLRSGSDYAGGAGGPGVVIVTPLY
jgi:hypothetical protein